MISLMQTWPAFSPNEIDWFNVQAVSLMNIQHGYTSLSVTDRNGKISWMTIPEGQGAEAAGFSKPERKELPLRLPSLRLSDDFHSMLVRSQTSGHYFLVYARAISTQEPELGFLVATFDVSEILDAMVGELVGPQFNFMIRDIDAHLLEAGDFADDGSIVETGNIAFLGRNRYVVHQPDGCGSGLNKESSVLHALQRAIQHGLFELHSQSIVPMHKEEQALEHYEILLRLPDGKGGLISPALFIPLAERHGLMNQVDGWVVDRTLSVLEAHPAHLERLGKVAINLSGLTLGDPSRLAGIVDRVMRSTVPAHKICFEITETAAVTNINAARHFIETLRSKGCLFALDDFGAGMSSFTYLKNLEVDFVKIDGSFVKNMARDSIDHETVKAISAIAQSMGKKTIAEFVTDQATCDALRELNVDYGQGFALGKPLPLMNRLHTRDNVNLFRA